MQWVEDHGTSTHLDLSGVETVEEYALIASALASKKNRLKWWIGDLIIQAKRFGDLYEQIQQFTGYKDGYLRNIESVSAAFAVDERSRKVLWRCYYDAYMSGLPHEDQVFLLNQAAEAPEFTSITSFQLILAEYKKAKGVESPVRPPTTRAMQADGHDLATIVDEQKATIVTQAAKIESLSAAVLKKEQELDELAGFKEPAAVSADAIPAPLLDAVVNGHGGQVVPIIDASDAARISYGADSEGHVWIMLTHTDGKALSGIIEHLEQDTGKSWTPGSAAGWAFEEVCDAIGIAIAGCKPLIVSDAVPPVEFHAKEVVSDEAFFSEP